MQTQSFLSGAIIGPHNFLDEPLGFLLLVLIKIRGDLPDTITPLPAIGCTAHAYKSHIRNVHIYTVTECFSQSVGGCLVLPSKFYHLRRILPHLSPQRANKTIALAVTVDEQSFMRPVPKYHKLQRK